MQNLTCTRSGEETSLKNGVISSQPTSWWLWAPSDLPDIQENDISRMWDMSFQDIAKFVWEKFERYGLDKETYNRVIDSAYWDQWHNSNITPVKHIASNLYSLHLWYGPTFAFKNIALEFLPRLLTELTNNKVANVIWASSWDTVNAAHNGVKWTSIRSIFMLPNKGPSAVQALQAKNGISNNPNALTILADTPFDPLQDIVKKLNSAEYSDFKDTHNTTSFNSINIGRILAQVVYYFRAYSQLLKDNVVENGQDVIFSVPSGNFWDALAGYYAKQMGLPIEKILIATNENDMLKKFIETGIYEPPKQGWEDFVQITNSPSMDIAKSSNFERMLFDIYDGDYTKIKQLYEQLAKEGSFQVESDILEKIQEIFIASSSTDSQRDKAIIEMWETYNHWIDPHTAAGVHPWLNEEYGLKYQNVPFIFLETSHVAQFGDELKQRNIIVPWMDEFDDTINTMKQNTPIEWRDYLHASWNFDDTFKVIQEAIEIVNNKMK